MSICVNVGNKKFLIKTEILENNEDFLITQIYNHSEMEKPDYDFPKNDPIIFEYFIIPYIKNIDMNNKFITNTIRKIFKVEYKIETYDDLENIKLLMINVNIEFKYFGISQLTYFGNKKLVKLVDFNKKLNGFLYKLECACENIMKIGSYNIYDDLSKAIGFKFNKDLFDINKILKNYFFEYEISSKRVIYALIYTARSFESAIDKTYLIDNKIAIKNTSNFFIKKKIDDYGEILNAINYLEENCSDYECDNDTINDELFHNICEFKKICASHKNEYILYQYRKEYYSIVCICDIKITTFTLKK